MDYLIIGILFFIGNVIWSITFLFYQSYAKKKGENIAAKEDSKEIAMLTELGKNTGYAKSDIHERTLIAAKEQRTESAKRVGTKYNLMKLKKGQKICDKRRY